MDSEETKNEFEEETPGNDIETEIVISDDDDLDVCPVCLEYQTYDSIVMECCNKLMHSECLTEWLKRKNNCPHCRTEQNSHYNSLSSSNLFANRNRDSFSFDIGVSGFFERLGRLVDVGATGISININPSRVYPSEQPPRQRARTFDEVIRGIPMRSRRNILPRRAPIRRAPARRYRRFDDLLDSIDMGISSINEYVAFRREVDELDRQIDRQIEMSVNQIVGRAAERVVEIALGVTGGEADAELGVSAPVEADVGVSMSINVVEPDRSRVYIYDEAHVADIYNDREEYVNNLSRYIDRMAELAPLLGRPIINEPYIPLNSWFSRPSQRVAGPLFNNWVADIERAAEPAGPRRVRFDPINIEIDFSDEEVPPPLEDENGNIIEPEDIDMLGVTQDRYEI